MINIIKRESGFVKLFSFLLFSFFVISAMADTDLDLQLAASSHIKFSAKGSITKEAWFNKLNENKLNYMGLRQILHDKNDFVSKMGVPDKVQVIDKFIFWYYNCSDGKLQLVIDSTTLNIAGDILCTRINEY